MRYEVLGIYTMVTGENCELGNFPSRKKAVEFIELNKNPLKFHGYYILEKARKTAYPWGYDVFNRKGECLISGIMAKTLKPNFWNSTKAFNEVFGELGLTWLNKEVA